MFGRMVDFHTHISDPDPEPSEEKLSAALRLARRHGIARIVLVGNLTMMSSDHDPSPELIASINTYTLRTIARHPEVYIGFCYLNPANPAGFTQDEIERCVVRGGMRGIKLWISVKATDSRLDPILASAEALDIPILHHAWYKQTAFSYNESTPAEIAELARRFPHVNIVMAHLAGVGVRGVLDIADTPNVLVDTSGGQPEAGLVEYAVKRLGAGRVVFGSDWPVRDFGAQVGRILGADLDPDEVASILGGNAARILRLERCG